MDAQKKFITTLFSAIFFLILFYSIMFIIIDPYDRFFFTPNKPKNFIVGQDRFVLPSLTRKAYFDSIIVGTSTSQILKPTLLNSLFDAKFVNVSMPSATPHEQIKLLQTFLKHHPKPKICVICLDLVWIEDDSTEEWNSLFYFPKHFLESSLVSLIWDLKDCLNLRSFKNIMAALKNFLTKQQKNNRMDGYHYFLPSDEKYDLKKARCHIYGQEAALPAIGFKKQSDKNTNLVEKFSFHKMKLLESFLSELPEQTQKILILPPCHAFAQACRLRQGGDKWKAFKQYAASLKNKFPNVFIVDFMIHSKITSNDLNYWDSLHYTQAVADTLCHHLFTAVIEGKAGEEYERY